MAARILANLLVVGGGVMIRAVARAYRQAIVNANKTGVAHEAVNNAARKMNKTMTLHEARSILGVAESTPWPEVVKRYETMFEKNGEMGTFYLQSKVHRAKECLEAAREAASK